MSAKQNSDSVKLTSFCSLMFCEFQDIWFALKELFVAEQKAFAFFSGDWPIHVDTATWFKDIPDGSHATEDSEAMNEDEGTLPGSKKRKSATARYVDDKRKKLEKQLSGKQKDGLMLQVMREDAELKKKLLVQSEQPSKADDALMKIADSTHTLSSQ